MAQKIKGITSITRKGTEYWYARVDGRRVYCGKNTKGYELAVAARSKYISKKYENREITAGLKVKKAKFNSFVELSNWYMTRPKIQQLISYSRSLSAVANVHRYFSKMHLGQIDVDTLEDYRESRKTEGAADNTINNEISLVSRMFHLALRRKKILSEMMPGEFPRENNAPPRRVVTDIEFEKLLEAADEDFEDVLICGYETAMRSTEIAELRASQVYLDVDHISGKKLDFIDVIDVKNKMPKTPPVSPRLKKVLERRLEGLDPDDRVFVDKTGAYYNTRISHKMRFCCKRAGVPYGDKLLDEQGNRIGVTFHCLRHTRTTKWVEAGWSDQIVMKATGHKDLKSYRGYVHLDAAAVMRLVEGDLAERHENGIKSSQSLATG